MSNIRKIHFVGIKGVGMTPLAVIAKEAGIKVSGSDVAESFITDEPLRKAGIVSIGGFAPENVGEVDLVITTGAHGGLDNVEVVEAKHRNIRVVTQGQALGEFMKGEIFDRPDMLGVSVSGSHGKTTTTAMIATMLWINGKDPSYAIGTSQIASLGSCGHYGKGEYFVAEADEYATEPVYDRRPKFLWQNPRYAIFTNIDLDHTDLYSSIEDVLDAFLGFTQNISPGGALIACKDDSHMQKLLSMYSGRVMTYGFSKNAQYQIENVRMSSGKMFFWIYHRETSLGEFVLNVPGEHNALNATAAVVFGLEIGLSIAQIKKGISAYKGSKRRFELIGTLTSGAIVYDDYAHHPAEIQQTLMSARKMFLGKRIVCVFQPHTYSRTKALFSEFVSAFSDSDEVVLLDIYASLREGRDDLVSSSSLAMEMKKVHKNVRYIPGVSEATEYIASQKYGSDTIIFTMGAGDVYKISEKLRFVSF